MNKLLAKEIINRKFEKTDDGRIFMPGANVFVGGAFEHWVNDDIENKEADGNIVVNEGLDHLLDVALSGATQKPNWYIGIFKANYTPLETDTAANIGTNATEIIVTDVVEAARPAWTEAGVTNQQITNSASVASYTSSVTMTAYGAFLVSNSAFGDGVATDKLMAAAAFGTSRALVNTDVLNVTYTLNVADA